MKNRLIIIVFLLITYYGYSKVLEVPYRETFKAAPSDPSKRPSSAPYLSGDTFRAFCDFVIDKTNRYINPKNVENGDVIFIEAHREYLDFFFQNVHPKINAHYILLTHNTGLSEFDQYLKYLDDDKIVAWFGKNLTLEHKKAFPIPIGLANKHWDHPRGFNGDTQLIENALKNAPQERGILLYMNFNPATNKKHRGSAIETFSKKKFCYSANRMPIKYYRDELTRSKFIVSPPGSGIDCYRTWEAIYLGAIPIILSSKLDKLYKDLPIVIVDNWHEVTEKFLNKKYKDIQGKLKNKKYKMQKLTANYWFEKISTYKEKAKFEKNLIHDKCFSENPKIPKIIHQICLNNKTPERYKKIKKSWLDKHPDWEYKFWSEKEIKKLGLENPEIAKYEILHRFGGLYVDIEFTCIKKFDLLHHYCDFYTGICIKNKETIIGLIGTYPKNPM